jgi:hypothetical protein
MSVADYFFEHHHNKCVFERKIFVACLILSAVSFAYVSSQLQKEPVRYELILLLSTSIIIVAGFALMCLLYTMILGYVLAILLGCIQYYGEAAKPTLLSGVGDTCSSD